MSNSATTMPSASVSGDAINSEITNRTHQTLIDGNKPGTHTLGVGGDATGANHVPATNGASSSLSSVPSPVMTIMSPRTPGMMSPPTSGGHDLVHDLPADLLHAGWRRFWSQREGREYFYNKVTRESRWEMPLLPGQVDFSSDPLGIGTPTAPATPNIQRQASTESLSNSGHPLGTKRSASEDGTLGMVIKRPTLAFNPFWDFSIPSNAIVLDRPPCNLPPPHPDVEVLRAQLVAKLRQSYEELCHSREGIKAPLDSFNRWLLERKVIDRGPDPLLPSQCSTTVSPAMYREIMNDIPVKLVKVKYSNEARKQLFSYAESAKSMIEKRGKTSDSRKVVKWNAEETMSWMRGNNNAKFEDYLERLAHLKRQCQPHLSEAAKIEVEGICSKIYALSCENVRKLQERHWQILSEFKIYPSSTQPIDGSPLHMVSCSPIRLSVPCPRMPPVEHQEQDDVITLRYKGEAHKINTTHFRKLEQLYQLNCIDDPPMEKFLSRVWCLLRRYQTLFGLGIGEGSGLQGAIPLSVFECLHRVFDVSFECFASPFNCYFKQYCSAFADTDGYFGSRGPILNFHPISGSFEANPPFSEELMETMIDHFESLLSESSQPLSFVVLIPDWRDPPTEALVRLESSRFANYGVVQAVYCEGQQAVLGSRFRRKNITIPAFEHIYRNGHQHMCSRAEMNIKSIHGTLAVFLQNDAGFAKWEPTAERMSELAISYQLPAEVKR